MEIRYYVCGLGYDKDNCAIDYEQHFGDFDTYEEAYELFVKLQCRSAESFFVDAPEVYSIDLRVEMCAVTDDSIECFHIRNEWGIFNPKFNKEGGNMKVRDFDVSLLIKECADFIYYTDVEEMDNDCSTEEQLLINAVSNVLLAFQLIEEKEDK